MQRFKRLFKPAILLSSALLMTLTACATQTPTPAISIDTSCTVFGPITFDRLKDTLPTIEQIKVYNAKWVERCRKVSK